MEIKYQENNLLYDKYQTVNTPDQDDNKSSYDTILVLVQNCDNIKVLQGN